MADVYSAITRSFANQNKMASVNKPGLLLFIVCLLAGFAASAAVHNPAPAVAGLLIGMYLLFAVKVADQWEKAALLRLGKYKGLRGPGLFFVIPVIDTVTGFVDQRIRVTDASAESALTRDTVPVNVDAIVFWVVWDVEKCILEVADFREAIQKSADRAARIHRTPRSRPDDHRARNARQGTAARARRKDHPVGHHGAVGRNPRRPHPSGARGCHVPPGAGRARAPGADHPRHSRNGNLVQVCRGRPGLRR